MGNDEVNPRHEPRQAKKGKQTWNLLEALRSILPQPWTNIAFQKCIVLSTSRTHHKTAKNVLIWQTTATQRIYGCYYSSGCIIPHKGEDIQTRLMSRVHWHMGLKPGRWRKQICKVWRGWNGWWWDGCAGCRWRIGNAVWLCTVFWVYRVWWMWWGVADWGGLGIWSIGMWMIGCQPVERSRWQRLDVRGGIGRLGKSVWMMTWRCLVTILNGRHSGMCGGTSYGQTSNPSVVWKNWTFSK